MLHLQNQEEVKSQIYWEKNISDIAIKDSRFVSSPRHVDSFLQAVEFSRIIGSPTTLPLHSRSSQEFHGSAIYSIFPNKIWEFEQSLTKENSDKFLSLLEAALECLGIYLEMMTYQQAKPILEEILLYVKVIMIVYI